MMRAPLSLVLVCILLSRDLRVVAADAVLHLGDRLINTASSHEIELGDVGFTSVRIGGQYTYHAPGGGVHFLHRGGICHLASDGLRLQWMNTPTVATGLTSTPGGGGVLAAIRSVDGSACVRFDPVADGWCSSELARTPSLYTLALSRGGDLMLTRDDERHVRLYQLPGFALLGRLPGERGDFLDGDYWIVEGPDGGISVLRPRSVEAVSTRPAGLALSVGPGGRLFYYCDPRSLAGHITTFDASEEEMSDTDVQVRLPGNLPLTRPAWSRDGRRLLFAGDTLEGVTMLQRVHVYSYDRIDRQATLLYRGRLTDPPERVWGAFWLE